MGPYRNYLPTLVKIQNPFLQVEKLKVYSSKKKKDYPVVYIFIGPLRYNIHICFNLKWYAYKHMLGTVSTGAVDGLFSQTFQLQFTKLKPNLHFNNVSENEHNFFLISLFDL